MASLAAWTTASGSSPFTWKIGAWIILATSVGYGREPPLAGRGGEADLVVDDDVDRAAGAEERQLRQPQRLVDDSLAGEGGVAVQQHRDDLAVLLVAARLLLGADDALDHRVDQFQVAGVGREADVDHPALGAGAVVGVAEVVLHVAVAFGGLVDDGAAEFATDDLVRLVQHVGQDVEPAAVGHADAHLLHAEGRAVIHQGVQQRDQGFGPLQAELLGAVVAGVEELLELLGGHELEEQGPALARRRRPGG